MPVTARLSKKCYDTLGEDLAIELVDWFNQVDVPVLDRHGRDRAHPHAHDRGLAALNHLLTMVPTQLYLDDDLHQRLKSLARKQGRTVSDLVREAVARVYAPVGVDERSETLRAVEGIWRDHEEVGDAHEYVRRMRADTHRTKPHR